MKRIVLCTFFSEHSGGLDSHFNLLKKYLKKKISDNTIDSMEEIKMKKKKNKIKIFIFLLQAVDN